MKPLVLVVIAAGYASVCPPDARAAGNGLAEIRRSIRYADEKTAEPAGDDANVPVENGAEVVVMEVFTVTESIEKRNLETAMKEKADAQAAEKFRWTQGGLIAVKKLGRVDAEVGLWPKLESSTAGKLGTQGVKLRVDILHFRW